MSARATDVVFFGQEGAGSFNESGLAGAWAAQATVSYTHLTLPTKA